MVLAKNMFVIATKQKHSKVLSNKNLGKINMVTYVRHLPRAKSWKIWRSTPTWQHAFLLLSNMLNWDWDNYCPNYRRFGIWLVARRPIPTYVQRNLTRTSSTMILELHTSRCSCTQNITWEYLFQLRCFFFCLTLAVWYLSHLSVYQFIYLSIYQSTYLLSHVLSKHISSPSCSNDPRTMETL